jgi:hypothetical protein
MILSNSATRLNLKLFLIIVFVLFGALRVSAQALPIETEIIVETTGYSMLSPSSIIFGGYYSGDFDHRGFTTYFEFKKDDNNLTTDPEKTIEIVRTRNEAEEFADFYTSPELRLFSTYYFRAVGYFNDNPDEKFYGQVLNLRTGNLPPPRGATYPYTINANNEVIPYATLFTSNITATSMTLNSTGLDPASTYKFKILGPSGSFDKQVTASNTGTAQASFTGLAENKTYTANVFKYNRETGFLSRSRAPSVQVTTPTTSTPPNVEDSSGDDTTTPADTSEFTGPTGLVPCVNNCEFNDLLKLINTVVKFVFVGLALPLAAIMFAYAGFELLTSGGSTEKKSKAKNIFIHVAIGLIVAAAAFLVIETVLSIVGARTDLGINWLGFKIKGI